MSLGGLREMRNSWLRDGRMSGGLRPAPGELKIVIIVGTPEGIGPMTPEPAPDWAHSVQALRAALRDGLNTALKARDAEALSAIRTAIAAIDNAEAIATTDTQRPVTSADIAGASSGVGSTEAVRRSISTGQLRDILADQIAE
jgi:uncharacterized protein